MSTVIHGVDIERIDIAKLQALRAEVHDDYESIQGEIEALEDEISSLRHREDKLGDDRDTIDGELAKRAAIAKTRAELVRRRP